MKKTHDLLAYPRIKIVQDDELFKFSIDALLLASFIDASDASKIMDLCTGNGPIPLYLTLKTNALIYGCDILPSAYDLAQESIKLNELEDRIKIYNDSLIDISKKGYLGIDANSFDIVCANPPYFKVGESSHINDSEELAIARHEVAVKMEDIFIESKRLLVDGGSLYLIYRLERLDDIIILASKHNFGVKRIRFVYPKEKSPALLVLVEAKKNKASDIKVLEPLYINDKDNYSKEVLDIFYLGKEK